VKCSDQYLWGSSLLVAPVVEKGATVRAVYLPHGIWYDFWTGERHEGGRKVQKPVDLETIPLYVRAGSILTLGPVKQFTGEKTDELLSITIYPGADGSFLLYEDDGTSFNYRQGEWMGIQLTWDDSRRTLHMQLAPGSLMLPPGRKPVLIRMGDLTANVTFEGKAVEVTLHDKKPS